MSGSVFVWCGWVCSDEVALAFESCCRGLWSMSVSRGLDAARADFVRLAEQLAEQSRDSRLNSESRDGGAAP